MNTLVVDDSRTVRRLLGHIVRELGSEVTEAENGREGLQRLHQMDKPELVLVDWNMPEMNGLEFIRAMRADAGYASVRVMMITTENDMSRVSLALEAGADEYVMKPFTRDVIVDKLRLLGVIPSQTDGAGSDVSSPQREEGLNVKQEIARALIIDDSRMARKYLTGMLGNLGLDVTEASGGREGLEQLQRLGTVDLLMVDYYMPDLSGIEVIQAVRANPDFSRLLVVMVTGEEDTAQVKGALEAGANASIRKPFTVDVLRDTLQRLGVIKG